MKNLPAPYYTPTPDVFGPDCFLDQYTPPKQTQVAPYATPPLPRPVYQESPQARHDRVMFNRSCALIGTLGACVTGLVYAAGTTAGTPGVMLLGLLVAWYVAKSGAKQDKRARPEKQETHHHHHYYYQGNFHNQNP